IGIEEGVELEFMKFQDQVADIFTKPLKIDTLQKLRMALGVVNQDSGTSRTIIVEGSGKTIWVAGRNHDCMSRFIPPWYGSY
ncbi:hypothetical protein HAX54_031368, partial [Datura stramonium]|nr:hypothetical protein [Datura stramonium]